MGKCVCKNIPFNLLFLKYVTFLLCNYCCKLRIFKHLPTTVTLNSMSPVVK